MLYSKEKERVERFKLALRMGLPIFSLTLLIAFIGLSRYFETIPISFFVTSIIILTIMIYFIFYLISKGFDERITDPISHTFTREYLLSIFKKEVTKGPYTLILVSIDNLHDINKRYSTINGDKVLRKFAEWTSDFLQEKGFDKVPIGHFKGGDLIIGLSGKKIDHTTLLDLLCIKAENKMIDDIEIDISGAIIDTTLTDDIDKLIVRLFELNQELKAQKQESLEEEEIDPSELELSVINAIREKRFSMHFQMAKIDDGLDIAESSIKLFGKQGKLIHQKSYIPVINRLGLSREFDTLMLEYLIDLSSRHDHPTIFALTLFPSTVRNQLFIEKAQILLSNNTAAKGRIMFILGEQEYYSRTRHYNDLLQAYRRMGALIALDRLGIYQTTLLYLKELEVDVVRFDQHYGKKIMDKGYQSLLRGLNISVHYLGMKTWIKMIQNHDAEILAHSIGVDYIQGNSIAKIVPIEELYNEVR